MKVRVEMEETLKVTRHYELEVDDVNELYQIVDEMESAGFMGRPSEFIPDDKLISYSDEMDYSSPDDVEYEFIDSERIEEV